jgi:hypothetical protein
VRLGPVTAKLCKAAMSPAPPAFDHWRPCRAAGIGRSGGRRAIPWRTGPRKPWPPASTEPRPTHWFCAIPVPMAISHSFAVTGPSLDPLPAWARSTPSARACCPRTR